MLDWCEANRFKGTGKLSIKNKERTGDNIQKSGVEKKAPERGVVSQMFSVPTISVVVKVNGWWATSIHGECQKRVMPESREKLQRACSYNPSDSCDA